MPSGDKSVADIQVNPAVLKLEGKPWTGTFQVTITNQMPRAATFNVSVVPRDGADGGWFLIQPKDKFVKLDQNGTYSFELKVTAAPPRPAAAGAPSVAAITNPGFQVQVAEDADMPNLVALSERRELAVSGAAPPPGGNKTLMWILIVGGAVLIIGGAVTAAIVIREKKSQACSADVPCPAGKECNDGRCVDPAPPDPNPDAKPEPEGPCVPGKGQACGHCGGTITCKGECNHPDPQRYGEKCHEDCDGTIGCDGKCQVNKPRNFGQGCGCGGKIACNGACDPPPPANLGQACGHCGGVFACGGICTVRDPDDFGQIKVKYTDTPTSLMDRREIRVGGACSPAHVFDRVDVVNRIGACDLIRRGAGSDCSVTVRVRGSVLVPSSCQVTIFERGVCR